MITNTQIDTISILLQIIGSWVAGINVLIAYNKTPIKNIKLKFNGDVGDVTYTNEFQRFTKIMRITFILGILILTIGLGLPLTKNKPDDNIPNQEQSHHKGNAN